MVLRFTELRQHLKMANQTIGAERVLLPRGY